MTIGASWYGVRRGCGDCSHARCANRTRYRHVSPWRVGADGSVRSVPKVEQESAGGEFGEEGFRLHEVLDVPDAGWQSGQVSDE